MKLNENSTNPNKVCYCLFSLSLKETLVLRVLENYNEFTDQEMFMKLEI